MKDTLILFSLHLFIFGVFIMYTTIQIEDKIALTFIVAYIVTTLDQLLIEIRNKK